MKNKVVIYIIFIFGILALIFWFCFGIIAARNESYIFDLENAGTGESEFLYYKDKKQNINYYTDDIEKITVSKLRLFFKTDKKELKDYIKEGKLREILNQLNVYKYYFNYGLETKYYNKDKTFVITKCHFYNSDDRIEYHINNEYIITECNRYSY